jgi:hypothetical protein
MKSRTLTLLPVVVAVAASLWTVTAAQAGPVEDHVGWLDYTQHTPWARPRAEGGDETVAALRAGSVALSSREQDRLAERAFRSTRTRADVAREAREANRRNHLQAVNADAGLQTVDEAIVAARAPRLFGAR